MLLIWFYISAFVVMLGAELNAELELQTRRDTTKGPERPMGQRGAFVADHVATASGPERAHAEPVGLAPRRAIGHTLARWRRACRGRAWWNW